MKLWHSFLKELKLASKSFYFWMEIIMAFIILVILTMVIPENFNTKTDEYIYLNLDNVYEEHMLDGISENGKFSPEDVIVKSKGEEYELTLYETETKYIYITSSEEDMVNLAKNEKKLGAMISMKDGKLFYDYYLQGYESDKYKNILTAFHVLDAETITEEFDTVKTRSLGDTVHVLNSRENVLPVFLYFNGSLMGLFIIAAYIFLDKGEGIIKAYAVTASKIWVYLTSKIGVMTVTSVVTSLIIVIPVMGLDANYLALLILLIASGFFVSVIGLILASYYTNIMQSFGVLYVLIILLSLPAIAYNIPSWGPVWVKMIPTYHMIEGFKETIVPNGDISYVMFTSLGFVVAGLLLFKFANYRFKKTLMVGG